MTLTWGIKKLHPQSLVYGHNVVVVRSGDRRTSHAVWGYPHWVSAPSDQIDDRTFTSPRCSKNDNIACIYAM
jgi:hypothetical protein